MKLSIPWVAPEQRASGLVGYLFYYSRAVPWARRHARGLRIYTGGQTPDGRRNMKILWVLGRGTAKWLRVQGERLHGPRMFSQRIDPPVPGSRSNQFPSIVDVPMPGCWRLTVSAGKRVIGRLTVLAVSE